MTWTPTTEVARAVYACGFEYTNERGWDIIKSRNDAWQRHTGFCWAYDEASAVLSMIIDCETFYFPYAGKVWLLELWKGQYGLETGCEIGLYRDDLSVAIRDDHDLDRLLLTGRQRYYNCVSDAERITMYARLRRRGQVLFDRGPEKHWWLTGFKWGVYTHDTKELSMYVQLTDFPSKEMRDSFARSVKRKFYSPTLLGDKGIAFEFDFPRTPQPGTRLALGLQKQTHNEHLVHAYNLYKKWKKIEKNDPNNITDPDGPLAKARKAAQAAEKKIRTVPLGGKVLDAVSSKVDKIKGAPSDADVVLAAYGAIHRFFETRKKWRLTPHAVD